MKKAYLLLLSVLLYAANAYPQTDNAKVFIDNVKIEAYNAAESMMPGASFRLKDWEGNTGMYQNTYQEYYQDNHFTESVMRLEYTMEKSGQRWK